jgi:hypothetical protein
VVVVLAQKGISGDMAVYSAVLTWRALQRLWSLPSPKQAPPTPFGWLEKGVVMRPSCLDMSPGPALDVGGVNVAASSLSPAMTTET